MHRVGLTNSYPAGLCNLAIPFDECPPIAQFVNMKNKILYIFISAVLPILVSCASVQTRLPVPNNAMLATETGKQEAEAFKRFLVMSKRLERISASILQANADLCPKTRTDFGLITHNKKSYPKHLRRAAMRRLGAGDTPTVLFVRKGGPAEIAGIGSGDTLLGNKGKPVSVFDASLRDTSTIHIRRSVLGIEMDMEMKMDTKPACDYPAILKMSGAINAYANGRSITVTTAMMEFTKTDEELALVIGHELAHNTMKHVRKAIWNTVVSGFATSEADYVGLYYMARAGYNLKEVENFWRRLGVKHPKSIVRANTHPVTPGRLLSIRLARQEIEAKRDAGQDLLPNYKPGKGQARE